MPEKKCEFYNKGECKAHYPSVINCSCLPKCSYKKLVKAKNAIYEIFHLSAHDFKNLIEMLAKVREIARKVFEEL